MDRPAFHPSLVATGGNTGDYQLNDGRVTLATTQQAAGANLTTMVVPLIGSSDHKVVHNYHDHANDPDGDYEAHPLLRKTGGASGVEQSFPMKLHYMLNDIEQDGLSHIVSWQPHGRCFVVHNQKLFVEKILGSWFRQSKIASFQRQLNIYGFQRLTTGPDKGGYYHEMFLRTKPGLASSIQRQKLKGTKTRRAASPESEPNFYTMNPLPPNKNSAKEAAVPVTGSCVPSSFSATQERTSNPVGPLTLQNIAPSMFSPTTTFDVHNVMMPHQFQQQQQHGLTVTSTCSVTLNSPEDFNKITGGALMGNAGQFSYPFERRPFTLSSSSVQPNGNGMMAPPAAGAPMINTTNNNDTLWAALSGGAATMPFSAATLRELGGENNHSADDNSGGKPLWLLR